MTFLETPIGGAWLLEPEPHPDERGLFTRLWCRDELARHGLSADFVQCNASFNPRKGTLRGLHFQAEPHAENKLVSCVRGSVFDVVVDLRVESTTFGRWFGTELTAENRRLMYVPTGCAHGYLTLQDECEVMYPVTETYHPASAGGVRWDDPRLAIAWPIEPAVMSPKDRSWPDLS
jgi:dTDP-4-dehydrorhamnose 3,5-epimerase